MTMGVQATQNLYNESLGCEVLESCPEFKTQECEERPLIQLIFCSRTSHQSRDIWTI